MAKKKAAQKPTRKRRRAVDSLPVEYVPPIGLTDRDRAVAEAYIECGNGADAMRLVDPSIKHPKQSAYQVLRKPAVKAYLVELRKAAQVNTIATATEMAERHTDIARTTVGQFLTAGGWIDTRKVKDPILGRAITSYRCTRRRVAGKPDEEIEEAEIRVADKVRSDERVSKLKGYDKPAESKVSVEIRAVIAQVQERVASVLAQHCTAEQIEAIMGDLAADAVGQPPVDVPMERQIAAEVPAP